MVRGDLPEGVRRARAIWVAAVPVLLAVVAGCGSGAPEAAEGAERPCGDAVLRDWADGSIDGAYESDCYLAALDSLPEDVRTYTSAEDDITRAMQSRGGATAGADGSDARAVAAPAPTQRQLSAARPGPADPSASSALRLPPVPVLLLGGLGLLLVAGVVTASAGHRIRRNG